MIARALVLLVLAAGVAWAVTPVPDPEAEAATPLIRMPPEITWSPERPGEGRLFTIRLTASIHTPIMGARGEAAGEELHFRRLDDRTFESFAAAPVDAGDSLRVTVRVAYAAGGEEGLEAWVPVTPAEYPLERLTVAPRFGAPPDSADAAHLERDRAKAARVARDAHRTPLILTDEVVMPRDSRVTGGFGDGREYNGQISSRHMGLDLRGLQGDTVVAAARGVVALVDEFLLAGNIVYVNHGGGLLSGYFHLSEQLVEVGDTVGPGTPIGRVGATGRVTGPHLHWVVRYGTTSVDPRSLAAVVGR